ncbi:hypothetical protein COOONC_03619 [Cooperia oncophora]
MSFDNHSRPTLKALYSGIADVISILTSCFHRLNRQLSLGPEYRLVVSIAVVLSGTTFLTHMIGNMIITINRYSALCLAKRYNEVWTRRNVWIMIIAQYTVSFAAFSHLIGVELLYKEGDDGRLIYAGLESSVSWVRVVFDQ